MNQSSGFMKKKILSKNLVQKGLIALAAGIIAFNLNVANPNYKYIDNVVEPAGISVQLGAKEARAEERYYANIPVLDVMPENYKDKVKSLGNAIIT